MVQLGKFLKFSMKAKIIFLKKFLARALLLA